MNPVKTYGTERDVRPSAGKRRRWSRFKQDGELSLLFLPGFLYLLIFAYIPMAGIVVAFKNFKVNLGVFRSEWVGFANFEFLFTTELAYRIVRNTILYSLSYMTVTMACALALAILMSELSRRWLKVHQTVLFLPFFLSWVIVSYITDTMLDHQSGFLNSMLEWFGMEPRMWYFENDAWPLLLNLVNLWKGIGFQTLIFYAGMMGIDYTYYEAAKIDGASKLQMAMKITIPLLAPIISVLIILSVANMFRGDFGLHYFIPRDSGMVYATTDIIDTFVFRALRSMGDVAMAAAVGLFQSVVGLVMVVLANFVIRKVNEENSLW
ncbi:sugar ABC transporter permease [Paenibacillus antri]|uniref:Sugar ABC transporter permease n=1 Tax=Paenibacillus antri TaxID=2582848 RepID=A0A5R9GBU1_9BACL|nr:ABC transporter permease subunit [Paenibacillus antri]TLS51786.1 sugar ABC transporter permease [Paenibacillus antri]